MSLDVDGPHTVGRWLRDRAASNPTKIAIDDRGVALDYGTLAHRAEQLATRLTDAGYGAGARIATVSGNSADHVVAFFACAFLGITFIPLSWRLTPTELAALIRRSGAALVLVEDEHVALASTALRMLDAEAPAYVFLGVSGVEAQVPFSSTPCEPRAVRDADPLLVIFTSGSEAAPKGVVLTHENCFWTNMALSQTMPMLSTDVVLAMLPQYHVAAWNVQPLLAWWAGATVVLERSFQPGRVLQLISERKVTTMMGVPTQYRMLQDSAGWDRADLSSLRHMLVGGATMPVELARVWAERGIAFTQGYGLTEAGPNVLALPPADFAAHPGAVGRPYPSVDVRLVDVATALVLEGEATGELWVRGPSTFAEYLDDPDATAKARSGPWLRTGDLAHRNASGVFRIVDRLKEIYVSGGENVAPAEVERALSAHPLVKAVAVVAAPDQVWGERGVAFVVAHSSFSADELLAFARERLAAFKLPARIVFLDDLPRSTLEKFDRATLRAHASQLVAASQKEEADDRVR
ncbi:acid--CoA ligase [Microbacterium sp. CH12i]|uniref:class I adenylate-forming enzyme family protein n=1 Tax=Microbacterium sp. CH12i TaxID=1479651 RepID=UPI0004617798|nr:AMP-binding protein [Microbacterium sp. CH12i]KDA05782.1 acid--CoA ligase [Microbacterium sp. CH12i]